MAKQPFLRAIMVAPATGGCILTPPPERRIHPADRRAALGLPDESGVLIGIAARLGGGVRMCPQPGARRQRAWEARNRKTQLHLNSGQNGTVASRHALGGSPAARRRAQPENERRTSRTQWSNATALLTCSWPWGSLGVALGWPWGGYWVPTACLPNGFGVALMSPGVAWGWLWLPGADPLRVEG
jgi:hypothetical protein